MNYELVQTLEAIKEKRNALLLEENEFMGAIEQEVLRALRERGEQMKWRVLEISRKGFFIFSNDVGLILPELLASYFSMHPIYLEDGISINVDSSEISIGFPNVKSALGFIDSFKIIVTEIDTVSQIIYHKVELERLYTELQNVN